MANPEDPRFDDQQHEDELDLFDLGLSDSEVEPGFELDSLTDLGTSEAEELIVSETEPVAEEIAPEPVVVADKKSKKEKKTKKEKPPKVKKEKVIKEKIPKPKREKKIKEPREKQPWDVSTIAFFAGILLMALTFVGVNIYVIIKFGLSGTPVFLAIFDLFAVFALAIPFLLRQARSKVTDADVVLGMAAIFLIVGCMFLLCNIAIN